MKSNRPNRVLLLLLELPRWQIARHVSYASQLGLEEGLQANGVEFFTVTTPWFSRVPKLCQGQQFDQVWMEVARHEELDPALLEWVEKAAPVRVGFLVESMEYRPEEAADWSELEVRRGKVADRLKFLTHVVACDEKDVENVSLPAMWWPQAVPRRYVTEGDPLGGNGHAVFSGAVYGKRGRFLEHAGLKELMWHLPSSEEGTDLPIRFDALDRGVGEVLQQEPGNGVVRLEGYLISLREIRRKCFEAWMEQLQSGCAVVNLPHYVKAYPGRVVEAMAAGRPVISWEIPDRPQTRELFQHEEEILLFSGDAPEELAEHIRRIRSDRRESRALTERARQKVLRSHTMEVRTQQILDWVEKGQEPLF